MTANFKKQVPTPSGRFYTYSQRKVVMKTDDL